MIDSLHDDRAHLDQILTARRAALAPDASTGVTVVTLSPGARMLWVVYLTILEDALKTVHALITYLESRS